MSDKLFRTSISHRKPAKTLAAIAIILILTSAYVFVSLPVTNAHTPPWTIPTYAYVVASPNPVGVNQPVFVIMWIDLPPPTATGITGDRWRNYSLNVTKPNGAVQTLGPFTSDATSSMFFKYTPDQVGTYKFDFTFPGQVLSLTGPAGLPGMPSDYINDTYLPSSASTTLTVQQDPLPPVPVYPLPTSYWTRPIDGQNTQWAAIASNWLGGAHLRGWVSLWQKDGIGPNSPHIMWTRPIEFGGIVGGTTAIPEVGYYSGGSYEGRFDDAVIMNGRLFFTLPLGHAAKGGGYISLDLRTGEEIWYRNDIGVNTTAAPSKGQLYEYESFNQHGVVGGILWAVSGSTWHAYDPFTGLWMYTLRNVPSGYEVYTQQGEIVRYVLNYQRRWLALWNNTAEHQGLQLGLGNDTDGYQWRPNGKSVDMSKAYTWNVTIPDLPGTRSPSIVSVLPGDLILGMSSNVGLTNIPRFTEDPYTIWALSDKPATRGQLLWIKNYPAPEGNITRMLAAQPVDIVNRVFTMTDYETGQRLGYSLDSGNLLWGPVGVPYQDPSAKAFQYYSSREGFPAYGNLYIGGYGGEILAYSMKDGSLLWKFNDTNSGLNTPWGLYPTPISLIADGKIYVNNNEHSPNYPIYKGESTHVLDAFTGKPIWSLAGSAGTSGGSRQPTSLLAEGFFVYYNFYDNQIYSIGKGPSAVTVSASPKVAVRGSDVLIEGTVTDQAAGAKQLVQSGKFNVVPAMSDGSMREWMEYLYMQKPRPENPIGVTIKLTAVDSSGVTTDLGTVTSDINGMFRKLWTPPTQGEYTIVAKYEGSESYWPSDASTFLGVSAAPSPSTPTSPTPTGPTTAPPPTISPSQPPPPDQIANTALYVAIAAAVIIIVVVAVAMVLRRRK
jgi:hypothetical protein